MIEETSGKETTQDLTVTLILGIEMTVQGTGIALSVTILILLEETNVTDAENLAPEAVGEITETAETVGVGTIIEAKVETVVTLVEETMAIVGKEMEEEILERPSQITTGIALNVKIQISHLELSVIGAVNHVPEVAEETQETAEIVVEETSEEAVEENVATVDEEILTGITEIAEMATEDFLIEMILCLTTNDQNLSRTISVKPEAKDLATLTTTLQNQSCLENSNEIEMIK
tara:strand:- start:2552 stop:3250 length:699 start_codon:yes stop_codon:yes gene_type:complete